MITNSSVPPSDDNLFVPSVEKEFDLLAGALAARFEELSLIREFTNNLELDQESLEVASALIQELAPCVGLRSLAIHLEKDTNRNTEATFLFSGTEIQPSYFHEIKRTLQENSLGDTRRIAISNDMDCPGGQKCHVVLVPVCRGEQVLGHMLGIRDSSKDELGTVEADLMKSTAMMLAVHLINKRQFVDLQLMLESTIQAFVCAIDAKDPYTHGHSTRVCNLSVAIAKTLGYDENQLDNLRMGAILHDIGKIGIDDAVLRKPSQLSKEEFEHIKTHPVIGYEIIKSIPKFKPFLPAVRSHHECWDGSGYPDGLKGENIPMDARIVAVADGFDAMTSDRPYRNGMSLEKVCQIMREGRGTQWATRVVDALLASPELMDKSLAAAQANRPAVNSATQKENVK